MRAKTGKTTVAMRLCAALACIAISGCTAMLLGGGQSDNTRVGANTRTAAQVSADNQIATAVRRRLLDDSVLGRYDFRVSAINRRVMLHGTVGSYEARERAIRIAGEVAGVERVDSRLAIGGGT